MVNWLAHKIPLSPSFSWWFPPVPSHLSLSCPQFDHHLRTQSYVIPLYLSMPWSKVSTEYSIHRLQYTLSTTYTAYCIIPRSTVSRSQASLSCLGRSCCTQFSTFEQLRVTQWIESELPSCLPAELAHPDWPPPGTPPFSLDRGLHVHLQTRFITASKCISELSRLRPPSSHYHGLQVCTITASNCTSKLAWWRPPSASPIPLDYGLQVHLQTCSITAFKGIANLARSGPPSASPISLDYSLQVNL